MFVTASVWEGGAACPVIATKLKLDGLGTIAGGGAITVRDTWMVCAVVTAPSETTLIVPVKVPGASVEEFTETCRLPGVTPPEEDTVSQEALLTALQARI